MRTGSGSFQVVAGETRCRRVASVGNRRGTAAFLAVAVADVALAAGVKPGWAKLRRVTKPLLMPTLMVGRERLTQRALVLGGAGDVALLGTGDAAFTTGLGAFLAGHVAWI